VYDEVVERFASLGHDEQPHGVATGGERFLDRVAPRDELVVGTDEVVGVGPRRWCGTDRRSILRVRPALCAIERPVERSLRWGEFTSLGLPEFASFLWPEIASLLRPEFPSLGRPRFASLRWPEFASLRPHRPPLFRAPTRVFERVVTVIAGAAFVGSALRPSLRRAAGTVTRRAKTA